MPTLFDSLEARRSRGSQPHLHGAADAQPGERAGARAERADARLLRPARLRRAHHLRGDLGGAAWASAIRTRRASGPTSRSRAGGTVTEGVHAAGGRIVLQLWHVGRISDPVYHDGALPVAPSAIAPKGHVSLMRPQRPLRRAARARDRARFRASSRPIAAAPRTPRRPASTASRSTAPTATCSTSSCRTARTSAPTLTAARSRTAPG